MKSTQELDEVLSTPSQTLVDLMRRLEGDLMILGVAGKMGPSLAQRAKRAITIAGVQKRVIGVARFSDDSVRQALESSGIETIQADLMDEGHLKALPDIVNLMYMVGHKFGTTGRESLTWAMNTYLPGRVADRFKQSRIVAFSSGNVYPLTAVKHGGSLESDNPEPVGEYAQSCLGRERILEHFSRNNGTPMLFYRLNYAIDMKYGVLYELAAAVRDGRPIDVTTGHVNVIWQGDANDVALRALELCDSPPKVLNVTGPETISIRLVAEAFGRLLGKSPVFEGQESDTALLNNASQSHGLFGYPETTLQQMIQWTAQWVASDGPTLNKPTHFQERQGRF